MKILKHLLLVSAMFTLNAFGQGAFQNLNFEGANGLPNLSPGDTAFVPMSNALPSWTGYLGTNQTSGALYNGVSDGGTLISLIGRSSDFSNNVIGGSYTAVLSAGDSGNQSMPYSSVAVAQTGLVPGPALSLRFDASGNVVGYMVVTFGGQNVLFYPLSAGPNYEVYGGDISGFAGQTGELRFTENPTTSNPFGTAFLDNIVFSTSPVPEPATCALILCGAAVFGVNRWRRRSSSRFRV
jgi:hypothetical protein